MHKLAQYKRLKELSDQSVEKGDIASAFEASKAIVALIEEGSLPNSLLPLHKYDLGIMHLVLERPKEAVDELDDVILLLGHSKRKSDLWLVNESKNVLALIEEFNVFDEEEYDGYSYQHLFFGNGQIAYNF